MVVHEAMISLISSDLGGGQVILLKGETTKGFKSAANEHEMLLSGFSQASLNLQSRHD